MSSRNWAVFGGLLLVALVTAGLISQVSSSQPDGLEYVAEQEGFASAEEQHDLAESPLADYGSGLGADSGTARGLAGIAGVLVTLAAGYAVFLLARKPKPGRSPLPPETSARD